MTTLSDETIRMILGMLKRGDTNQSIAMHFGLNQGRISEIKNPHKYVSMHKHSRRAVELTPYPENMLPAIDGGRRRRSPDLSHIFDKDTRVYDASYVQNKLHLNNSDVEKVFSDIDIVELAKKKEQSGNDPSITSRVVRFVTANNHKYKADVMRAIYEFILFEQGLSE